MAKLVEFITPTWIREKEDKCIPIYDPSIDGERIELVRCKDCKYGRTAVSAYADMYCERLGRCVTADWFCADGEKKEGV